MLPAITLPVGGVALRDVTRVICYYSTIQVSMDSDDNSPVSSPATDHLGINPYSFEPVNDSNGSTDDLDSTTDEQDDRLGNRDWSVQQHS